MSCYANDTTCAYTSTGTAPQLFSSALQFFAAAQCFIKTVVVPEADVCDNDEFDFILVGAGTAGCVLANRLTECKKWNVLLIEAGDEAPVEARVPNLDKGMFFTKYDWGYRTTNDSRISQANQNGSIIWPRGKMLGGSSDLNGMIYVRGVKADYDDWYEAGNEEWNYEDVFEHFKKAESFQYMKLLKNPVVNALYGKKGPLDLNRFNSTYRPLTEDVLSAWNEMGVKNVVDLNTVDNFKSGIATVTAANGVRSSGDYSYIEPVKNRPNLVILTNTFATRILLDKSKRAYGVEAELNGKKYKFYAKLEVIVSAGSINSPQLLMLSGIGPREHLNAKNVSCKVDSPMVGKNLQDHCIIPIPICGNGPMGPDNATQYFGAIQYLFNRTGYLAQNSFSDILAFYSLDDKADTSAPQYQSHMTILWRNLSTVHSIFTNRFKYLEPVPTSFTNLNKNHLIFLFQFSYLHPQSRGNISLNTNNPKDHPLIYPNYFLNPEDLDAAVAGIQKLTKIVETSYFKSIDAFLGRVNWPACDKFELGSDSYWKCICINMVLTEYHPVATCKMGPNPDTSVVNSRLKVHGVKNLRVIDASVMPTITSGNTNGPTTMIGERGATLVKEDHECYCEKFDFIIVGAGTAGSVLANRLTECEHWSVLLVEAGDEAPVESRIPALDKYMYGSKYDWGYLTTNDSRTSQAFQNGSIIYTRGKMIGGSSNINNMIYIKGVKADYDAWYDAGNKEWSFDIVEEYFKKAESYQYMNLLKNRKVNDAYGHKGPLVVNRFNSTYRPLTEQVLDAWNEMGVKKVDDINVPGIVKAGIIGATAANGMRYGSDYAYIRPIQNRTNLKILKNTLVTKILLDKAKKACGIEAESNGKKLIFYAKLEVILSAGSTNSPQLLMLSGIGPKEHLEEKNISCEVNSPMVGQNLQDHLLVPVTIYGNGPDATDEATLNFGAIEYLYNRSGYLAQNSIADIAAFFTSSADTKQPEYLSFMNFVPKNTSYVYSTFADLFRFKEPIPSCITELNRNHMLYTFEFVLSHPLSVGNISLNTNNPQDSPLIFPKYFSNPKDLDAAVTGIKMVTQILKTKFFRSVDAFLGRISWPACDEFELDSTKYWKCICINIVLTLFHPVGTCKMGPNPDTSVVDSRLRVHGVKNLRVIDASIMPSITSGNTNGPTNMIGERGADLVKQDHQCQIMC